MRDYSEELTELVRNSVEEIVAELELPAIWDGAKTRLEACGGGTDDGCVFGEYVLYIDDRLAVEIMASALFRGFQDCDDADGHFTRDVYLDELGDFGYTIVAVTDVNNLEPAEGGHNDN